MLTRRRAVAALLGALIVTLLAAAPAHFGVDVQDLYLPSCHKR